MSSNPLGNKKAIEALLLYSENARWQVVPYITCTLLAVGKSWQEKGLIIAVLSGGIFKLIRSRRIDSASLCSLAGRYDYPIPTLFLATVPSSKFPAQLCASEGNRGLNIYVRFLCKLFNTMLYLPPLIFYCFGGCWDIGPRTVATLALTARRSRLHLI